MRAKKDTPYVVNIEKFVRVLLEKGLIPRKCKKNSGGITKFQCKGLEKHFHSLGSFFQYLRIERDGQTELTFEVMFIHEPPP
jgi:hypothetical protein